jgi:S1-C subfamily serine protease
MSPRTIFVVTVVICGILAYAYFGSGTVRAASLSEIEEATVLLHENATSNCTAQVVHSGDETILLTANHCVDAEKSEYSIKTTVRDGRETVSHTFYMADVFKRFPKADLAVLRLRDKTTAFVATEIATQEELDAALFKGAKVLAAGYPSTRFIAQRDLVFTEGLFTGETESLVKETEALLYRATASIFYGNSGGGLYLETKDGWKLIGVASQIDPSLPWQTSLWSPLEEIEIALKGAWVGSIDLSAPGYRER